MSRVIFAIAIATAFATASLAQTADDQPMCAGCPTPAQLRALTTAVPVPPAGFAIPPAAAPAATQNTITTTAPVTSSTSISVGTLAGQFLAWIMVAFSAPIGSLAVWIMVRILKNLGITATDALRDRFKDMVVNALNISAPVVQQRLAGQGQVVIKNAIVESAVSYVQAHGADTIKALGLDPKSGDAVEAIRARIETAIADPTAPTPAVLNPPTPVIAKA
jgi:hypothetical protein